MSIYKVEITDTMKKEAKKQTIKRATYKKKHFANTKHSEEESDVIGFLGEFSACIMLGIDWKSNIRDNYLSPDNGDGKCLMGIFDVKTETLPKNYLDKLIKGDIDDDLIYGRRLINEGQKQGLLNTDLIIFGAMDQDKLDVWYPIGWLETDYILKNYNPTQKRPDGGQYPSAAFPVRTSDLKPIEDLIDKEEI